MKAKEYFEKYFNDIPEIKTEDERMRRALCFMQDLTKEVLDACEFRHNFSNIAVETAVKEQNDKFNSVENMIEKKFHMTLLRRNGFREYWKSEF